MTAFCESCMLGKSSKLPFHCRQTYANSFLHTLHTDVWGPASVSSYNGFRFYLLIVDEYSHYIWLFPMARKSNVAMIFPAFLQQMAKQFTNSVKIIQSDGGGEFVNTVLQTYFAANGIIHILSCPRTPEQNGLAERRHRHIVETSLTLLAHASIPVKYWTTAFNIAVFLINRLPSSVLDHMSPHELAFGSSPNYDFLRVFGCSCYPLLSPFGRTKLEYKSIYCVFLGFSANHKGYCCLEPHSGRLYISRHVKFNEQHFPFKNVTASHSSRSQLFQLQAFPTSLHNTALHHSPTSSQSTGMAVVEVVPTQLMEAIHSSVHLSPIPPTPALHSSSPASAPPSIPQRTHQMVTRTQTGNLKPKVFLSFRYHISVCFLADLAAQPPEPTSYRQALQNP